jgi:hypothetical protein
MSSIPCKNPEFMLDANLTSLFLVKKFILRIVIIIKLLIDNFLVSSDSGLFLVTGERGVGKYPFFERGKENCGTDIFFF